MPLSKCEKCQCGEGGSASLILANTAVEGESGLTKRYASLKVSLQPHGQPEIGLRLRDAQFVIERLQQRNLLCPIQVLISPLCQMQIPGVVLLRHLLQASILLKFLKGILVSSIE